MQADSFAPIQISKHLVGSCLLQNAVRVALQDTDVATHTELCDAVMQPRIKYAMANSPFLDPSQYLFGNDIYIDNKLIRVAHSRPIFVVQVTGDTIALCMENDFMSMAEVKFATSPFKT